jgi:hypothetical protein
MEKKKMTQNNFISITSDQTRIGHFNEKEPDQVWLNPWCNQDHDFRIWYTQLEKKMMGEKYFKVSGFGIYFLEKE